MATGAPFAGDLIRAPVAVASLVAARRVAVGPPRLVRVWFRVRVRVWVRVRVRVRVRVKVRVTVRVSGKPFLDLRVPSDRLPYGMTKL